VKVAHPRSERVLFRSTHPCAADHIGTISCRLNPFDAFRRDYDEMVLEFFLRVRLEERNKKVQHIPCRGWIDFQPDYTGMTSKGEDDPIAEMLIKCDENPLVFDSFPENLSVNLPAIDRLRRRASHRIPQSATHSPRGLQTSGRGTTGSIPTAIGRATVVVA